MKRSSPGAADLFRQPIVPPPPPAAAPARGELLALELWPGDRFVRDGQLHTVIRVEISVDLVVAECQRGAAGPARLQMQPREFLRRAELPIGELERRNA